MGLWGTISILDVHKDTNVKGGWGPPGLPWWAGAEVGGGYQLAVEGGGK